METLRVIKGKRILVTGKPRISRVGNEELNQLSRVGVGCGGSSLNGLSRILAKTGLSKNGYRRPRSRPSQEEGSEEPT